MRLYTDLSKFILDFGCNLKCDSMFIEHLKNVSCMSYTRI